MGVWSGRFDGLTLVSFIKRISSTLARSEIMSHEVKIGYAIMYSIIYIMVEIAVVVALGETIIWVFLGTGIFTLVVFFYAVASAVGHENELAAINTELIRSTTFSKKCQYGRLL